MGLSASASAFPPTLAFLRTGAIFTFHLSQAADIFLSGGS